MNILSRNRPVGLVVGAAGFIGSYLVEELLSKGIQIIGVDDFSSGGRDNLYESGRDKNFQLISEPPELLGSLQLPRLDYAVFCLNESVNSFKFQQYLKAFVDLCKKHHSKIAFCSSIDLYDVCKENLTNLRFGEKMLAEATVAKKINIRVVRLVAVFGPRMHFQDHDPIIRLIKSAVLGKLNQQATPLEFTTRALYVKDAVQLLIKALMHGSTAQKIYDGVALSPIKVSEIKQVLLDPLWYGEKGFKPTQLPPWPTPNLHKTCKELSWKPTTDIVSALKETLVYFELHKDRVPLDLAPEKKSSGESEKQEEIGEKGDGEIPKTKKTYSFPQVNRKELRYKIITLVGAAVIFYTLIFPILRFSFAAWMLRIHFENSLQQMTVGNFSGAERESADAKDNAQYLNQFMEKLVFLQNIDLLRNYYQVAATTIDVADKAAEANYHTMVGAKLLASGLAVISGEEAGDIIKILNDAKTELDTADSTAGEVSANLSNPHFISQMPKGLTATLTNLQNISSAYRKTIDLGRSLTYLLPAAIASDGTKSYLVVLSDNRVLRPGGGALRSFVEITFDHGRLLQIKGDSVENLDRQFSGQITPPVELKTDLGENNWRLKDASFDLDFPTSAHNIAWFYSKESGHKVSGVIAIDLSSMSKFLQAIGPVKVNSMAEEITDNNLAVKIPIGREGNQVATEALTALVERVFYLSKQNWVKLAKNSNEALNQKHLLVYLTDPALFSYLVSSHLAGEVTPQEKAKVGERDGFLALSETNMSQGQDSTTIDRSVTLQSRIDLSGLVSHKLTINYAASDKLLSKYVNRLKVYLPTGVKLIKTSWGGKTLKEASPFSDYGRLGYSWLLELGVGEQKQLVMEYQDADPVKFENKELKYQLYLVKQPGQASIPVDFKLTFPPEYKAFTSLPIGLGEVSVKSDFTEDQTFSVTLKQ